MSSKFLQFLLVSSICVTSLVSAAVDPPVVEYNFLQGEIPSEELTDAIFPRSDPISIGYLYQILKVMDKEFGRHGISYWADFGTLLGAVRHGGIIPWDDDADVCLMSKERGRVASLIPIFKKYGLELTMCHPLPWKLHRPGDWYFCVDIFFVSKVPNDPEGQLTFYSNWTGHWYEDEVKTLTRVPFGPIELSVPEKVWRRLYAQYGTDCMEKAVYHNHIYGDLPYKVTIVDFSPAEYIVDPNNIIIPLD